MLSHQTSALAAGHTPATCSAVSLARFPALSRLRQEVAAIRLPPSRQPTPPPPPAKNHFLNPTRATTVLLLCIASLKSTAVRMPKCKHLPFPPPPISHPAPQTPRLTLIFNLVFCDYCDVYLTHDSMSVRKAHNSGRNHLRNVIDYYQQIGHEKAQSVIDSITSSYAAEGQAHNNPMLPHNQPGGLGGMGGLGGPGGFGAAGAPGAFPGAPLGAPPGGVSFPPPPGGLPPFPFPGGVPPPGFPALPGAGGAAGAGGAPGGFPAIRKSSQTPYSTDRRPSSIRRANRRPFNPHSSSPTRLKLLHASLSTTGKRVDANRW